MSWTEQRDGSWSRPLDCHDRLFQFIGDQAKPLDREHWLLVGNVRLKLSPTKADSIADELRQAWKRLRLQHPDIALELVEGNEKRYLPVHSQQALHAWSDATFRIESDVPSADHFFTHRLRRADPQATCHWVPASCELVLVSQHWRWDGCGLLMMLHELLAQLEHPPSAPTASVDLDGREAARLVPSLDVVLGMPEIEKEDKTRALGWDKQADDLLGKFIAGIPSIGVYKAPSSSSDAPSPVPQLPGKTIRVEQVIPRELTASIRRAARSRHNVTVTSAVHASAIVATVRANPTSPATRFTSWAMFDLRKHCPAPFDGPLHAPSLRTFGLPINLDARAPWPDLAHALQTIYHEQPWTPPDSDLLYNRVPYINKVITMLATPPPPDLPPASEPSISSLGVLDRYVKPRYADDVDVADVSVAVHQLSPQLYVHVWSWDGEMHLSTCFNETYHEREFVTEWLADVVGILVENLLS
ncbi:uncharacterized protein KD926_000838 [Aspergillus affinis]|uniref:uncharacterized protein n=1 Tax=Aspergillus affinis TaxID=1070780 RepID=UPI0022FDEECB|nr:uncharacterized protein KD926_000838 [Aspergillus affinis]KAI9037121.1 hypothetical protein KD926_000838 [Aspergillus affinis]